MTSADTMQETLLGKLRRQFVPRVPKVLRSLPSLEFEAGEKTTAEHNELEIQEIFPLTYGQRILTVRQKAGGASSEESKVLKIGVVLSGGQASGGHNVITGIFDAVKELNSSSQVIGFLGGPKGIMINRFTVLEKETIDKYRNTGGFDMIRAGRDKIQTEEQMLASLETVNKNDLDGLVVIGGDDSNTNAAVLAEFFQKHESKCVVVGVPKTIDGDLQNEYIEMSFGFDTAVKTYSHMISNIARDCISAEKAWHFVKLMGRDASHVTLDTAIQTQPNIALIGEEVQAENMLLSDVTDYMVDIIERRALAGKHYGLCLIPEGIIGFIPSMKALIAELNEMLKEGSPHLERIERMEEMSERIAYIREMLKASSLTNLKNFDVMPRDIQVQLLLERDPHGNIQMSQIPIEQLFKLICEKKLHQRRKWAALGAKFRVNGHFFGYDGRSGFPSNFDCQYCYALGRVSALLCRYQCNGYMARVYDLHLDVEDWKVGGIPITMLMNIEIRHGKPKPVIKKSLVDVEEGQKFAYFLKRRDDWAIDDSYRIVGPIQFFGPTEITDVPPMNVLLKKTNDVVWPVTGGSSETESKEDQ